MKKNLIHCGLALLLATIVFLSGCMSPLDYEADHAASFAPAEQDRLVIYTSHLEAVYAPLIKEFEARTGIWVQVETGGTRELLSLISSDTDTSCDLIFGGGVDSLEAYKELFAPYESSLLSYVNEAYLSSDHAWTPFSSLPIVLVYNPKLVRKNPPTGFGSLLDPAWQGNIAFANPEVSGSAFTALSALLQILPGEDEALMRAFSDNIGNSLISTSEQVPLEVANGNCYIGITLEETALRSIAEGYDITYVYPSEGTCALPDGIAIISGCAHEENAQKFIDFVLGTEVQQYLTDHLNRRSVRTDIKTAEGMTDFVLYPYDMEWVNSHQEELKTLWKAIRTEVEQ